MASYTFKGGISFGLVYVPVTLHGSVKSNDIGFNMLDRQTMSRVKYKKTCVDCGDREVRKEDIVKGYEYEDGKYVVFTDEDFDKIKSPKDKDINIESFVDLSDIDPLYFDKPYYVVPTGAEKAFAVLLKAMEEEKKAAVAKTVLGTKETLIAIRAKDGQMLLNTLFFEEEIQNNPAKIVDTPTEARELDLAKALIRGMSGAFEPKRYRDEYRERLSAAIEEKIDGKEIHAPEQRRDTHVADLMEALQLSLKSLSGNGKRVKSSAIDSGADETKKRLPPKKKRVTSADGAY